MNIVSNALGLMFILSTVSAQAITAEECRQLGRGASSQADIQMIEEGEVKSLTAKTLFCQPSKENRYNDPKAKLGIIASNTPSCAILYHLDVAHSLSSQLGYEQVELRVLKGSGIRDLSESRLRDISNRDNSIMDKTSKERSNCNPGRPLRPYCQISKFDFATLTANTVDIIYYDLTAEASAPKLDPPLAIETNKSCKVVEEIKLK